MPADGGTHKAEAHDDRPAAAPARTSANSIPAADIEQVMRNLERTAPSRETTDEELWRRASAGDRDAFGDLFERHARAIYNFCFRSTGEWAAAEDLASATFLHAWRRHTEIRFAGSSALPFLYGVAAHLLRNHVRGARRHRSALARLPEADPAVPDPADDVAGRLDDQRPASWFTRELLLSAWAGRARLPRQQPPSPCEGRRRRTLRQGWPTERR